MDKLYRLIRLSDSFYAEHPKELFPEILEKKNRVYTCLMISINSDFFICIPFRANINHNNAFLFKNTKRSRFKRSGLDYSKIVIISDLRYISDDIALVDNDEFSEMRKHIALISREVYRYILRFREYCSGKKDMHTQEYERCYKYSTLRYFINEIQLLSPQMLEIPGKL